MLGIGFLEFWWPLNWWPLVHIILYSSVRTTTANVCVHSKRRLNFEKSTWGGGGGQIVLKRSRAKCIEMRYIVYLCRHTRTLCTILNSIIYRPWILMFTLNSLIKCVYTCNRITRMFRCERDNLSASPATLIKYCGQAMGPVDGQVFRDFRIRAQQAGILYRPSDIVLFRHYYRAGPTK